MDWSGRALRQWASDIGWNRRWWPVLLMGLLAALVTGFALRPGSTAILPDPHPLHGAQPYVTLLCQFSGPPPQPAETLKPVAYYDQLMVGSADSVDRFWRQVSYGAINLSGSKAFGWFQMARPASAYQPDSGRADLDALARDCTATADGAAGSALNFLDYAGINLVFSECVDRPRGGAKELRLDGAMRLYRITWLCPGNASSQQIVAHEIGHSFGLAHSEDSLGSEYGNNWDLMSNAASCAPTTDLGVLAQQPIAYDKDVLGWIAPADKFVARKPAVSTIQLDYLESARPTSPGFLLAEVALPHGRFYTVEARGRLGYDAALPAAGVLIHEIDPARQNRAQLVAAAPTTGAGALLSAAGGWPVGSVFTDSASNVAVSVDRQLEGGFVVTVYTGALPWPLPPAQQAGASSATMLSWQPTARGRKYEVQVARVPAESPQPVDSAAGWGATFVTDQPSLAAQLPAGQYRWQVRELPHGSWSPPQIVVAGRSPSWRSAELIAQVNAPLRVAPVVSARPDGGAEVAWASDDKQRRVSVTHAAWQGDAWAVEDLFTGSRRGLALSFTPAGDLKVTWPAASVAGGAPLSSPVVALDAGGRAHAIWAGANRGGRGIFAAVLDAHAPSAGPAATPVPGVQAVPVAPDAPDSTKSSPALALDGAGKAQAVWIEMREGRSAVYTAGQRADGSWGPARRLSDANQTIYGRPAIAVDGPGNAYAVWASGVDCGGPAPLTQLSFAERPAGGQWQPPITLAAPSAGQRYIDPVIATNDAGEIYVAWGEANDAAYRLYTAYRGQTGHWESPQVAAEGGATSAAMAISLAVDASGDAYLTWAESQGAAANAVRFAATR